MVSNLQDVLNSLDMSIALENQYFSEEPYLSGDELGFDFSDDLTVQSDMILSNVASSSSSGSSVVTVKEEAVALKTETRKRGSKFMRKKAAPYPPKLALIPKATSTGIRTAQPNMSRRTRDTMLYVFPSFDRCDSLLFFPSTLARLMNSGDIPAIAKLFQSHFHQSCTVVGRRGVHKGLNLPALTQKMELMEEMQPDRITCIHSTKVDGNVMRAVGYSKFTKVRSINENVARFARHKNATHGLDFSWHKHMQHKLEKEDRPQQEKDRILALIEKDCDLVVYSRMETSFTIDDFTKRVTHFDFSFTITSMEEVKNATKTDS